MDKAETSDFEVRRQLLQMDMLYEIGVALGNSLDLDRVAQEILNRALVMVDARAGLLLEKDLGAPSLKSIAHLGLGTNPPELEQLLQLDALAESWEKRTLIQRECTLTQRHHLCFVPLEGRGEVSGLLVVADKERRDGAVGPFSENDEHLLRSFAYQAGAALQNARLHFRLQEAYEELKAAQQKLAQLEQLRALGDVASEVAHDLNHILTIIMGRADLYLNFPKDPGSAMQSIFAATQRGMEIVGRIQKFTRLGVGQKRSTVDLETLIREAVADTQVLWEERGPQTRGAIDWQLQLPPLPPAQANATELKEVITNLLVNALEAMPEGGRLTVEARPAAEKVVIGIRDSGPGMPPEFQQRIFDPFFTTKDDLGRGLGLSIVYRLVHAHGGELEVDSAPGQGTCFTISLPLSAERPSIHREGDGGVEAHLGG